MSATDAALLTEYRQIGTSTWSDVLDEIGIEGVVGGLVRRSGAGRFAGFAVTAKAKAGPLGSFKREAFAVGQMIDAVGPGEVLAIDVGGAEVSTFGGLASLATKIRGVAAVVIDGACRDAEKYAKPVCGWPAATSRPDRERSASMWSISVNRSPSAA